MSKATLLRLCRVMCEAGVPRHMRRAVIEIGWAHDLTVARQSLNDRPLFAVGDAN